MNNIYYHIMFAKLLITSAIEKHDDWEDFGPVPGEKEKRYWHSKSTGEMRVQIIRPRTPSKKEKVEDLEKSEKSLTVSDGSKTKHIQNLSKLSKIYVAVLKNSSDNYTTMLALNGIKSDPENKIDKKTIDDLISKRSEENKRLKDLENMLDDKILKIKKQLVVSHGEEFKNTAVRNIMWQGYPENFINGVLDADVEGAAGGKRSESSVGRNTIFFDFDVNGNGSVFKPYGVPNRKSQGKEGALNEVIAYQISEAMGFNLVPPTKMATKKIDGEKHETETGTYTGSSQLLVPGKTLVQFRRGRDQHLYFKSKNFRKCLQKMAIFDFLIGNEDRSHHNLVIDDKNEIAYAIDHGIAISQEESYIGFGNKELQELLLDCGGIDLGLIKAVHADIIKNKDRINKSFDITYPERAEKIRTAFWKNVNNLYDGKTSKFGDVVKQASVSFLRNK